MWTFANCSLQNYPGNAKMYFWCLCRVEIWSTSPQRKDSPMFFSEAVVCITKRKIILIVELPTNIFVMEDCPCPAVNMNRGRQCRARYQTPCPRYLLWLIWQKCSCMLMPDLHYVCGFLDLPVGTQPKKGTEELNLQPSERKGSFV